MVAVAVANSAKRWAGSWRVGHRCAVSALGGGNPQRRFRSSESVREFPSAESLLSLWFGTLGPSGEVEEETKRQWFTKSPAFDRRLADSYGAALAEAELHAGHLEAWEPATPRRQLARVLLLDQVPRNTRRGSAGSFACDAWALAASHEALDLSWEQHLAEVEHCFLLMPFMHSEELLVQEEGVRRFAALANGPSSGSPADSPLSGLLKSFHSFAEQHRDIVARFGRFPHRNSVLGRVSTPEEEEFLLQPGSSF